MEHFKNQKGSTWNNTKNMTLEYNKPIEVSQKAYTIIMNEYPMTCAGKEEAGKYFIKLWHMQHHNEILKTIQQNPLNQ